MMTNFEILLYCNENLILYNISAIRKKTCKINTLTECEFISKGHIGEAYGLAVSPNGKNLVTCGSDRVLRLYKQSDEIVEITDQAEMEREQQEPLATGPVTVVPGLGELNLPSKKTLDSETGVSYSPPKTANYTLQLSSQIYFLPIIFLFFGSYMAAEILL